MTDDRPDRPAGSTTATSADAPDPGSVQPDATQPLTPVPGPGPGADPVPDDPGAERLVAISFVVTILSGVALLALYIAGGDTQLEGVLLCLCLGGLGVGLIIWAHRLLPNRLHVEQRHPMSRDPRAAAELADAITVERGFTRRTLLMRLLLGAVGGLLAALAVPVFSLGPAPGNALFVTPWKKGLRAVDITGKVVNQDQIPVGGVLTVFPEGFPGSADGQTLLIHVGEGLLQLPPDRMAWAPNGFVAYSKICTHAGCPVGLYRDAIHSLICPCHQSQFDVLNGAKPSFGPAARPLPQLPIQLQADGTFVALSDYTEPVGPSFWNRTSGETTP
jgi:ubiquinol-cytochrome c reductase iron-sulfur subunit